MHKEKGIALAFVAFNTSKGDILVYEDGGECPLAGVYVRRNVQILI